MALTPEQLKAIQDYYAGPLANARPYQDAQGNVYQQDGNGGYLNYGINASQAPGAAYQRFGSDGAQGKDGAFIDQDKGEGLWKLAAMAAIGGGAGYGAGLFGGGAGAAAGAGGAGFTPMTFGTTGAIGGYGAATGTGAAWGAAGGAAGAAAGAYSPASFGVNPTAAELTGGVHIPGSALPGASASVFDGGGGDGVVGGDGSYGPDFSQGYTDGGTAGGALDTGYAGATTAAALNGLNGTSLLPAGTGGSSFLNSLKGMLPSGASSLLGPLATVGGAILGSQGNKNEASSTKTMDPRLDGPVFGAGGVVPQAQSLLAQQMTPQAQQGWLNMQNVGQSLLSRPIAGNGFGTIQRK